MKQKVICLLLALSLLLTGCGWGGGKKYVSVKPHLEQRQNAQTEAAVAKNSLDLIHILEDMIRSCTENGVIYIAEYPAEHLESGMEVAVGYAVNTYPLGAYAVESIGYEVGTNGGLPAMAVNISYRHSDAEIRQIRDIVTMDEAGALVAEALKDYDPRLVIRAEMYFETDFQQMVRSFAETYPETVMELPQVTVEIYGTGPDRLVELSFTYQNGRDALRLMNSQVKPFFEAAALYVSGDGAQRQKYAQLYSFLMERFDYKVETSITPAYSLLHHGVGDSRAFATVYGAMCRRAGLECMVVTGTRSGEPWVWNIILVDGYYQHVDLLRCSEQGRFREVADRDMTGYVWDYSAYPECPVIWTPAAQESDGKQQTEKEPDRETEPAATEQETEPEEIPEETVEETTEMTLPEITEETVSEETKNFEEK